MTPALDFDDFDVLRKLIHTHCGIWLGDTKVTFLQVQLRPRLQACKISSAREYYHFIRYDPAGTEEIQHLLDAIVINETWFFREVEPLLAWRDEIFVKHPSPRRVWSAGCSTGEEPYTLVMLLSEVSSGSLTASFEILATDLSQRALAHARAGVYDPHALRHTEARWVERYFQPAPPATAPAPRPAHRAVGDDLKRRVRFMHANLVDVGLAALIGAVDLIVCRNVLIYFDDESRRKVMHNFYSALKPGGHLILGHSETLAHANVPFEVARVGGRLMYHKTAAGTLS